MNSKVNTLIVFGVLVITTACASGQIETLIEDQANTISEQLSNEGVQLQQEGIGPLEITPLPPGEQRTPPPVEGDGGNINSRGEITTSAAPGGEPGVIESKAPSGLSLEEEVESVISWLTYQDQDYPFSIAYPDSYVVLPAEIQSDTAGPELLHQVRFLDHQLASGDTADLEIPNFRIEIYDLGNHSLESFLDENFDRGNREPFSQGGEIGIRVFLDQMIAPNEFYYFTDQSLVYKLTPIGEYSQEMLASFQIQ